VWGSAGVCSGIHEMGSSKGKISKFVPAPCPRNRLKGGNVAKVGRDAKARKNGDE